METLVKRVAGVLLFVFAGLTLPVSGQEAQQFPSTPLKFGAFEARFDPAGTFTLKGQDGPRSMETGSSPDPKSN
ncbi:MAG TPA: hypothetical protein VJU84_09435 [Pyrinomonadaceae bacterium]|nr:hypothetical protein [Pyrinomonadaceae bacterium]